MYKVLTVCCHAEFISASQTNLYKVKDPETSSG